MSLKHDDYLLISANEIVVVVEVKSETIARVIETIRAEDHIGAWEHFGLTSVLNEGEGLELLN